MCSERIKDLIKPLNDMSLIKLKIEISEYNLHTTDGVNVFDNIYADLVNMISSKSV